MTVNALRARVEIFGSLRKSLRADFVRHGAIVFAASTACNIFNYLFNFALSRRLGVEGFAALSSLSSLIVIVSIPTAVLALVVVKYTAVYHAAGDAARIRRLSQILLKATAVGGIVLFALGWLLNRQIGSFLRIDDGPAVLVCLGIIAIGVATPSARSILQGEQDFVRYSASIVLETLLKVAFAVLFVYSGFGVKGAMLGWILGTSCALAYTVCAVLRKHGARSVDAAPLNLDLRRLFYTTTGVATATAFLTLITFMDVLLVKHYFSPGQAGLYAAVNLGGKVIFFLVAFVPAVLLPKAVAREVSGTNPLPLLLQALAVTALMSIAVLIVFGFFPGDVVLALAGRAFAGAAPFVLPYGISMCLLGIVTLLVNYRIGVHRFGFLYSLGAVLVCEVMGIVLFHRTLWDVVHIVLTGNAAAVAACVFGLRPKARKRAKRGTASA